MKTLEAWLEEIAKVHSHETELGLERTRTVAETMQLLPVPYKVITVAGTNGKGTTASLLAEIYRHAGYQTGLYTSPHLLRFNERININGKDASDQHIVEAFEAIDAARNHMALTYFEFAVLAALYCFQQANLNIVILEIGIGGRFDACNIVDPDVAVVTSIGLDHTAWLGETREEIALEKAGIFRRSKPAICGDLDCPRSLVKHAKRIRASLYQQTQDFFVEIGHNHWTWHSAAQVYHRLPLPEIPLQNASTALMALQCLQGKVPVSQEAIAEGLSMTKVPGRYQGFELHCPVVLDVAHNVEAANLLAQRLERQPCKGKTFAVFSVQADKDVAGIIMQMDKVIDEWFYAPLAVSSGLSMEHLDAAFDYVRERRAFDTVEQALEMALKVAKSQDRVVIFGSFFLASAVLPILQAKGQGKA